MSRRANVAYKIKFKDYERTYSGQTKQYLHKRSSNHLNSIKNNGGYCVGQTFTAQKSPSRFQTS